VTVSCPLCGQSCRSEDHRVDHLTDAHDAFSWVVRGRPLPVDAEVADD
jgi:hypothetical protein